MQRLVRRDLHLYHERNEGSRNVCSCCSMSHQSSNAVIRVRLLALSKYVFANKTAYDQYIGFRVSYLQESARQLPPGRWPVSRDSPVAIR